MKLSVSIPDEDVEFLDGFAQRSGSESRSAVLHAAIALLKAAELADDYAAAFAEWTSSPEGELWDATAADGLRA